MGTVVTKRDRSPGSDSARPSQQKLQNAFETRPGSLKDFKVQRLDHCHIGWSLDRNHLWSQPSNKRRRLVTERSDVCQIHRFTLFANAKSHHYSLDYTFLDCRCGILGFESFWKGWRSSNCLLHGNNHLRSHLRNHSGDLNPAWKRSRTGNEPSSGEKHHYRRHFDGFSPESVSAKYCSSLYSTSHH